MRRFVRILITTFAACLLVLATLLAVQSVRSLWKTDIVTRYAGRSAGGEQRYYRLHAVSVDGRLSLSVECELTPSWMIKQALDTGRPWELWLNRATYRGPGTVRDPAFLGFTYLGPDKFSRRGDGSYTFRVGAPWWALALASSAFPIATFARRWRQRRSDRRGLCSICGYDLRATPDRCPECGTAARPPNNQPMHRTVPAV